MTSDVKINESLKVEIVNVEEYEEETSWMLQFSGQCGWMKFSATPYSPDEHTAQAWLDLADGKKDLRCYMGNGHGDFMVRGEIMEITACPSGAGGDLDVSVEIPLSMVAPLLRKAIAEAQERGLPFVEDDSADADDSSSAEPSDANNATPATSNAK